MHKIKRLEDPASSGRPLPSQREGGGTVALPGSLSAASPWLRPPLSKGAPTVQGSDWTKGIDLGGVEMASATVASVKLEVGLEASCSSRRRAMRMCG
jgi:hypothetical protein